MKKTNVPIVTLAIFMTTFMTAIEGTIVSTAMPTIVSDLDGLEIMNWVVSIFLLMTAVSTPLYGKLADSIGRKPVFLFGIALFVIGSSLCGLAQNMIELILFRVIQGLGSGAVQPVAITIIADLYTLQKRAKMLGLLGSGLSYCSAFRWFYCATPVLALGLLYQCTNRNHCVFISTSVFERA